MRRQTKGQPLTLGDVYASLTRFGSGLGLSDPSPGRVLLTLAMAALFVTSVNARSAAAAPSEQPETGHGIHIVQDGETLFGLALRYGMTVEELRRLNGLRPGGYLLAGKGLRVPLTRAVNARADEPALLGAARPHSSAADSVAIAADTAQGGAGHQPTRYTIRPGDTLFGIARIFNADVETLKVTNGLPLDGAIRAGDTLLLPGEGPRGTTPAAGSSANDGARASDGRRGGHTTTVVVSHGDTLTAIAERFGTTPAALARLNGLSGDMIAVGQELRVPRAGTGVSTGGGQKRIEVVISEQRMYVWEGETLVYNWTISTGMASHPTRRGHFAVQSKIANAWSNAWQLWMPNWLGIYWAGGSENGIHALPIINGQRLWGGNLGSPISYGCIVLGINESQLLYDWAELGTPVDIRD